MLTAENQVPDFLEASRFFDELLRKDSPCRIGDEYPLVFRPENSQVLDLNFSVTPDFDQLSKKNGAVWVLRDVDGIQAGLASLLRRVRLHEDIELSILFVGSVVTDPRFRNQGLQRILFEKLERAASETEIDFILLWSNQLEFYRKLGFELGGLQATWSCPHADLLNKNPPPVTFGRTTEIEFREVWFKNFKKKPFIVNRSLHEMKQLWKIPEMYVACTENAYALYKKGEDFDGMCHEWAGPADEVLACFDRLREHRRDLRILSPGIVQDPDEMQIIRQLEMKAFESRLEYLGLFKILSTRFVTQDLQPETLKLPFFVWGLDSI